MNEEEQNVDLHLFFLHDDAAEIFHSYVACTLRIVFVVPRLIECAIVAGGRMLLRGRAASVQKSPSQQESDAPEPDLQADHRGGAGEDG